MDIALDVRSVLSTNELSITLRYAFLWACTLGSNWSVPEGTLPCVHCVGSHLHHFIFSFAKHRFTLGCHRCLDSFIIYYLLK